MTKRQTTIITILSIAAFVLALLVSTRYWLRLDLTKNKAYTISKVSRNLHREIPDPVNITFYVSGRLKTYNTVFGEIEDTLREYAAYSKGKITLQVRDPVRTGVAQQIESMGFQARQLPIIEQDQASFITVYSGILIEYLDKTDIIPWVEATYALEYDLTSRIRSMVNDTQRRIGMLVGDTYRYWEEDFRYLNMTLTNAGYNIRLISGGEEIPDNLPALFVLGGAEDLDESALYRIDRYIQLGGKVLFAVKGIYVDIYSGSLEARHHADMGLLDMIASYGVVIRPELALDRNALIMQYQSRTAGGIVQRMTRYPLWISVTSDNANAQHPVTAAFYGLDIYWASPLELVPPSGVEAQPLFTSSDQGWAMRQSFYTSPDVPYMLEIEAEQTRGSKILGASLSGTFPSFFAGVDMQGLPGMPDMPDMPEEAAFSRIIVVGDVDFATDIINATQAAHNLEFLLRAADWLSNDDDIISIRNRLPQASRLDRIADPAKRAAVGSFSFILNTIFIPALVICAGIILAYRRRSLSRREDSNV